MLSEPWQEPLQKAASETDLVERRSGRSGRLPRERCQEALGTSPEAWLSERVEEQPAEQAWALSRPPEVLVDCLP